LDINTIVADNILIVISFLIAAVVYLSILLIIVYLSYLDLDSRNILS